MQMRGTLPPGQPWDVVVDLFFYREPEETKDEAEEGAAGDAFGGAVPDAYGAQGLPAPPGKHAIHLADSSRFHKYTSWFLWQPQVHLLPETLQHRGLEA